MNTNPHDNSTMFQSTQVNSVNNIKGLIVQKKLLESIKMELKKYEPPRPQLTITQTTGNDIIPFHTDYYKLADWLCGCPKKNALFCYICLLTNTPIGGRDAWIHEGVTELLRLQNWVLDHQHSIRHIHSSLGYILIGNKNIIDQLQREHSLSITQYNKKVQENRFLLGKLIDCVRYHTNHEKEMKNIVGDCSNGIEPVFAELLESVYQVCLALIIVEIDQSDFLAVELYEATEMATSQELIFVVRYELQGEVYERFICFETPENKHVTGISDVILCTLEKLGVNKAPDKFICYSYDSFLAVHNKFWGIHSIINAVYPKARFVHSYADNPETVIEHLASQFKEIKLFFAQLDSCSAFLLNTSRATKLLSPDCKFATKWEAVNTFSAHADTVAVCLDRIIDLEGEQSILAEAASVKLTLADHSFSYWLDFFWKLLSQCSTLFDCLDALDTHDIVAFKAQVKQIRSNFQIKYKNKLPCPSAANDTTGEKSSVQVKQKPQSESEQSHKERNKAEVAKKICNLVMEYVDERFSGTAGMSVRAEGPIGEPHVANTELARAMEIFKLDRNAFRHEFEILSTREEFSNIGGVQVLLQYFYENDLMHAFPNTFTLLKMCCTVPMSTSEPGRRFSTVTKCRDFFKTVHCKENRDVLAMCRLEKDLMKNTSNFCDIVIDHFCMKYNKQANFEYQRVC